MKRIAPMLALVLAAAGASARASNEPPAAIHGCPDARGNVVYQDDPCDERAAAPPKPVARVAAKAAPRTVAGSTPKPGAKSAPRPVSHAAPPPPLAGPIRRVIDPSAFTSDPKWGSPERTLKTFVAAMKDGDRALARSCLTSSALAEFGPRVETASPESLRSTVAGYTGFVLEGEVGPYWSIRALRANTRPKWIFFERIPDGTWKISAI
jgi:hypothetical protein